MKTVVWLPCIYDLLSHWSHTDQYVSLVFTHVSLLWQIISNTTWVNDWLFISVFILLYWMRLWVYSIQPVCHKVKRNQYVLLMYSFSSLINCLLWPKLMSALWHRREHPAGGRSCIILQGGTGPLLRHFSQPRLEQHWMCFIVNMYSRCVITPLGKHTLQQ